MGESSPFSIFPTLPRPPRKPDLGHLTGWADNFHRATMDLLGRMNRNLASGLVVPTGASHSGGYAAAASPGVGTSFLRSDAILEFPQALGVVGAGTKNITLTEDAAVAGFGAVLTAASTFSTNKFLSLYAPTAINPFALGRLGNFLVGGAQPKEAIMMGFIGTYGTGTITDGSEVNTGCRFMDIFMTDSSNQNEPTTGSSHNYSDTTVAVSPPTATPWNNTAKAVAAWGGRVTIANTKYGSNTSFYYQTGGMTHSAGIGSPTVPRVAIFHAFSLKNTAAAGKTISQLSSFSGNDVDELGATTPGVITRRSLIEQMAAWTCGTTKRSLDAFNTAEVKSFDFLASTPGKGFMCKDTQGTARYWRWYMDATGAAGGQLYIDAFGGVGGQRDTGQTGTITMFMQDTGTAAPAA